MRILIVCSYKPQMPEGCVPFILEQVDALRAQGCECEYYHIKGKGLLGYLHEIPGLRKRIREFKPDVIHAHYGLSCLLTNMATRRVPVVSTYHGSDINLPKVRSFSKMAMRLSAWNIFVSKKNMALAGVVEGKKASLVPCGINIPLPWNDLQKQKVEQLTLNQWVETIMPKGKKYVLFAGAFDNAIKDPERAKQTMNELTNEGINAELIELKGYTRDQVNALMYNCDAFLMTSKTEGSPQVIKEALACGCPIVSVDVGDVKERLEGVEGCYVVESRKPMDIAEALRKALAFEDRTEGRKRIEELGYTNELVAQKIIKIYQHVLGENKQR